ncbi:MAG TPA: dienelactone hydrolase family protein [Acidimicrobiales bacterium]|jgi:carboxymethylenebutenolidase|nr:dienelactone hydrolase family protein [Acidimicrobiales bacterium]
MRITLDSGTVAELARPPGRGSGLGLVLAPDIAGLRPLFDELCEQLAERHGWVVCAPEPFPGRETLDVEGRRAALAGFDDGRVIGDLVDAAGRTGCHQTAVMGFCMGGMYALKATASGAFSRAVAFYGMIRVPETWRGPGQGEPLDALARAGDVPVLAVVGERDPYTPPADIDALAGLSNVAVARYPDAEHGFAHDPSRPAYRSGDAADAWRRALAFLAGQPATSHQAGS